jgi:hypothetical protein
LRRQIANLPRFVLFDQSDGLSAVTSIVPVHFRSITAACASITGEIITAAGLQRYSTNVHAALTARAKMGGPR